MYGMLLLLLLLMILLVDKSPNETAVAAATADMIIKTDRIMTTMCMTARIISSVWHISLIQYQALPSNYLVSCCEIW